MAKILQIIARLNVGGSARHVILLSEKLQQLGHDVLLVHGVVEDDEQDMSWFAEERGIKKVQIPSMMRSINFRNDLESTRLLLNLIWSFKPDVVHTHTSKAGLLGRLVAFIYCIFSRSNPSVIHTFHGHTFHSYFSKLQSYLFLFLERFLARIATDKIITLSALQLSEICNQYKVGSLSKHQMIPLGEDFEFVENIDKKKIRLEFGINSDVTVFGIVGRIAKIKDHALFLHSVYEFQMNRPDSKVAFLVIGDGSDELVLELKDIIKSLSIQNVVFTGNIRNTEEIYSLINVLVITSLNEGTPVTILEAFASGVPVISSAVGGVPDLLQGGDLGELVYSRDPKDFAQKFSHFIDNPVKHLQKVTKAKDYVLKHHSVDAMTGLTVKTYDLS